MTLPTISIIIPSRERPAGLLRAIESIRATQGDYHVEIVVVLDEPDHETISLTGNLPGVTQVISGPGDAYLGRPQDKYNLGYAATTGEWIVTGSDDITFDSPGWLDESLRLGGAGGFCGLSDGGIDPNWCCVLVMARRNYIDTVMRGYVGLPWYHVWWADVEWAERAKRVGAYRANTTIKLTHYHWARKTAEVDRIAKLALALAPEDEVTYTARAKRHFRDDHK